MNVSLATSTNAQAHDLAVELARFGFTLPNDASTATTVLSKLQARQQRMPTHQRLAQVVDLLQQRASLLARGETEAQLTAGLRLQ